MNQMNQKFLIIALCLNIIFLFTSNGWADTVCCCDITCKYTTAFGGAIERSVDKCYTLGLGNEVLVCTKDAACAAIIEFGWIYYGDWTGSGCAEKEEDSSWCPSNHLLGSDDPGLDSLRQFRDEVLSTSEKGRKLTEAYYKYGDVLIEVFEENPGIEDFATEILEKMIERLQTALGSEEELLTDEIAADIEILIDELDAVVASPGLKKTLKQIKRDMKKGTLF